MSENSEIAGCCLVAVGLLMIIVSLILTITGLPLGIFVLGIPVFLAGGAFLGKVPNPKATTIAS